MATILDDIRAYKRDEIAALRQRGRAALEDGARAAPPVRDFAKALLRARDVHGYGLICEIKRASPSAGLIRADFDPPTLARAYEAGGATCLSVLTDGPSFQGSAEYLAAARGAVALPVLRKDFLYDPIQVLEARAMGADAILIIMATVSDGQAQELDSAARAFDMSVLVEVHNEAELTRALDLSSPLIGINNRDLNTFVTSLDTTERLAPHVPGDRLIVAESGLKTKADLTRLRAAGAGAFLIGESLMRQDDVTAATRALTA